MRALSKLVEEDLNNIILPILFQIITEDMKDIITDNNHKRIHSQ